MTRRVERVNDLLRDEISTIVLRELKDPRLAGMISITEVEISSDYHYAKVFVSVMGTEEEQASTLTGLTAAASFIRRELRNRLKSLRHIPALQFKADHSIERGARISALLNEVAREHAVNTPPAPVEHDGGA